MKTFLLHIDYTPLPALKLNIQAGQYHLIICKNPSNSKLFLDWLEGKKYFPESKIEYLESSTIRNDFLLLKKYYSVIRFKLNENESAQFYYQQRYHATENDDITKVSEFIGAISEGYEQKLWEKFCLQETMQETVNMLSTGEFRKVYLLKHAFSDKKIFFIDEPFAGIDPESRRTLDELFVFLTKQGHAVVIVSSEKSDEYSADIITEIPTNNLDLTFELPFETLELMDDVACDEIFSLNNISAIYNNRKVLDQINWTVRKNEKWRLSGKNGAGKSSLLSFVYADNPQVYCNEVYLFGKKRGSGESIWEIKDQIGFYSSEFHRYFNKSFTVMEAIRSIVFQNPYKKKELSEAQDSFLQELLLWFKLDDKLETSLYEITTIEQKITLFIGVLLKNAPLLILDEAFQGFDEENILKTKLILDKYIQHRTFIFVTHKSEEVPECVNKMFLLEKGKGSIALKNKIKIKYRIHL